MSITPLPPAPSPLDTPEEFNAKAYTFFAALALFAAEASDLAANVDFTAGDIQRALAITAPGAGAADAITAVFAPAITALADGMTLYVRASDANATPTPTFSPGAGIAPAIIVKDGGQALEAGSIAGAGHWLRLTWDGTLARWVLGNPRPVFASAAENAAGVVEGKPVDPLGIREALNAVGVAPIFACRAWVNFDGTAQGVWAGGASTVSRVLGSTTATIETTEPHRLATGNMVYALTGVAAGGYKVTVLGPKTFTVTTTATTSLNGVPITFRVVAIRAAGNVGSVADLGTGNYAINFEVPLPDEKYGWSWSASNVQSFLDADPPPTAACLVVLARNASSAAVDVPYASLTVYR